MSRIDLAAEKDPSYYCCTTKFFSDGKVVGEGDHLPSRSYNESASWGAFISLPQNLAIMP